MISRFPVRLIGAALLPGLIVSCKKEDTGNAELVQQVTETAAATEILRDENGQTRDKLDALSTRIRELEADSLTEKESRQEIIHRIKTLETERATLPALSAAAPAGKKTAASTPKAEEKPAAAPAFDESKPIPNSITDKVVVIEGDQGKGTGFLCSTEGALWLYTAAHVISGNKSITVRDQQNNRYQTFDTMEVADGVDLVRLKILNSDVKGLELQTPDHSSEIGDPVAAIGNSDGTGVVAAEKGEIRGKGPDSWEVSTQIIPGNSGGPVISRKDMKVIGIVTHLILGKKETWASDTRFAEVRRFAARLDRTYKWTAITPARFLKEYQIISQLDDDTKVAYAAITIYNQRISNTGETYTRTNQYRQLTPEEAAQEKADEAARRNWISEARTIIQNNPNNGITMTLNKILGRPASYSASENRRELQDSITGKLALGGNLIKPEAFTWYHRESYEQSIIWRRKLLDQMRN